MENMVFFLTCIHSLEKKNVTTSYIFMVRRILLGYIRSNVKNRVRVRKSQNELELKYQQRNHQEWDKEWRMQKNKDKVWRKSSTELVSVIPPKHPLLEKSSLLSTPGILLEALYCGRLIPRQQYHSFLTHLAPPLALNPLICCF